MSYKDLNLEIKESLKNWKEIVKGYQVPSTKKAIVQVITSFGPYLALWVLMYFSMRWSIWLTLGLGMLNAFFLVRIFIIQHDCGHQSFFKSQRWNNYVGYFCSFFSFIPYKYWAKVHNFHHGHSGQIEVWDIGDIPTLTVKQYKEKGTLGKFIYRIFRSPLVTFVIAPTYYLLISNRIPLVRIANIKKLTWNQLKNNIAISTYYKLPRVFQWLTGNIGIHHIHHLSSLIPNYNLEKCMKENLVLNKYVTVITFWESLKLMTHKLWDEERSRMISFGEYNRLSKMGLA